VDLELPHNTLTNVEFTITNVTHLCRDYRLFVLTCPKEPVGLNHSSNLSAIYDLSLKTLPTSEDTCNEPFTGPYYWIPLPNGTWELIAFAERPVGREIGHVHIWPEVLRVIGEKWGKEPEKLVRRMGGYPYALPRGRVVWLAKQGWGIAHGDDAPPGMRLELVGRRFILPTSRTKVFFDEHEVMILEHLRALESDLKIDLELKAPPVPDFDDF